MVATEPGQSRSMASNKDGRRDIASASSSLLTSTKAFFALWTSRMSMSKPAVLSVRLMAGPSIFELARTSWSTSGLATFDGMPPLPDAVDVLFADRGNFEFVGALLAARRTKLSSSCKSRRSYGRRHFRRS